MTGATNNTLIGLIDAGGSAGAWGRDRQCYLVFHLAVWRRHGQTVETGKRRCEWPVSEGSLDALMQQLRPYTFVQVEIDGRADSKVTNLRRVLRIGAHDPELARLTEELRRPVTIEHPRFGRLEYDRPTGLYEGCTQWCGETVGLSLDCARPEAPEAVLAAAERLFAAQEDWQRRVEDCAVAQLLPIRNDAWLQEDEDETSAEEFRRRIALVSIYVDESGHFSFWFSDDDLFYGHSIEVGGDLADGPSRADIAG